MKFELSVIIVCLSTVALGLFKDQAGVHDWHKKFIGIVAKAHFSSTLENRVYVSSREKDTLALLNIQDGTIIWRHSGSTFEWIIEGNTILVGKQFQQDISLIQKLDPSTGLVVWSAYVPMQMELRKESILIKKNIILILGNNGICRLNLLSGALNWCNENKKGSEFIWLADDEILTTISENSITSYDVKNGALIESKDVANVHYGNNSVLAVDGNTALWIDSGMLRVARLIGDKFLSSSMSLPKDIKVKQVSLKDNVFVIKSSNSVQKGTLDKELKITLRENLKSDFLVHSLNEIVLAERKNENLQLTFQKGDNPVKLPNADILMDVFTHSAGIFRFTLVQCKDGKLIMFKGDVPLWEEEEALSYIEDVQRVELPESVLLKRHFEPNPQSSILSVYLQRWMFHVEKYQNYLKNLRLHQRDESKFINHTSLQRDSFGIKQLLVVSTKVGKIFALESDSGSISWSKFINYEKVRMFLTKNVHVAPIPELTLVAGKQDHSTEILTLNALNGLEISRYKEVQKQLSHAFQLPEKLPNGEGILAIVFHQSDDILIHPPKAVSDKKFLEKLFSKTFYTELKQESNSLKGYQITKTHKDKFVSNVLWRMDLKVKENIVAVSKRSEFDVSPSLGRVLGDRSVLYKYLNPNMFALVTANNDKKILTIYILDSVSGKVIKRVEHDNYVPGGSVHVIQSENWFLYHFMSEQPLVRSSKKSNAITQVNVLELYEDGVPDKRKVSTNFSSFENLEPTLKSQSFVLNYDISSVTITNTKSGITTREVVFGSKNGQLMSMSKSQLDPRRPMKAASQLTAEEKEEMLIPYKPQLEENFREVLTYELELSPFKGIFAFPAELESTALVFAYGKDLFSTRRYPSKNFDQLGEEFSKLNLMAVIAALTVAIFIAKEIARKRKLQKEWE